MGRLSTEELTMPSQGGSHEQHVKAGQQSHKNEDDKRRQSQEAKDESGQRGGSGNFKNDPERASEAGRKGGQS
jgi:general stress protein YciG